MKQIEDSKQDIDKYLEDMAVSGWFSIMLICVQGKGRDGVYGTSAVIIWKTLYHLTAPVTWC